MPEAISELPYQGEKEMLLVDEIDSKAFLAKLCIVFRQQFKDKPVQFAVATDVWIQRLNRAGDESCIRYC